MRRALLTASVFLVAAGPAAAAPPATVKVTRCSLSAAEAVFHARMRLIADAHRMALRFKLLERTHADAFARLTAPGIESWHWSKPGVRRFGHRKAFRNLLENASYRVKVSYRWYAEDGTLLKSTRRRSRTCHQFARLPNLTPELVRADPTGVPGVLRYELRVTNSGRAAVKDAPVRLTVDGGVVNALSLKRLRAGETRTMGVRGPECASWARAEVDADRLIAETTDDDNVHQLDCATLRNPA